MSLHAQYTRFISRPGQREALKDVLMKTSRIVSGSDGCRLYIINEDTNHEDAIWLTEIWETEEHQVIARSLDGALELATETNMLLAKEPEKVEMEAVAGKGLN